MRRLVVAFAAMLLACSTAAPLEPDCPDGSLCGACPAGTHGDDCHPCEPVQRCAGDVTCTTATDSACDTCETGFFGASCEPCAPIDGCVGAITCTDEADSVCDACEAGFFGANCEPCTPIEGCVGAITCTGEADSVCDACAHGTYGPRCAACAPLPGCTRDVSCTGPDDSVCDPCPPPSGETCALCVDAAATPDGCGGCWSDPFQDLQTALTAADVLVDAGTCAEGVEVWVAAGTYHPSSDGDRMRSFVLRDGVTILGGFFGHEATRDARDPAAAITILSGDLAGNDEGDFLQIDENAHHVLRAMNVGASAILDGVFVEGGNADGAGSLGHGGGMYLDGASPTLKQITFRRNSASSGGALYNRHASPLLTEVEFEGNRAVCVGGYSGGGAVYNRGASEPLLLDVTFTANRAICDAGPYRGGAAMMSVHISDLLIPKPKLVGARFIGNVAETDSAVEYAGGGAILSLWSSLEVVNGLFVGNEVKGRGRGGALHLMFDVTGCDHQLQLCWSDPSAEYEECDAAWSECTLGPEADESILRTILTNVTLVGNAADGAAGALYALQTGADTIHITNGIVWDNAGGGDQVQPLGSGSFVVGHTCLEDGAVGGVGNLLGCEPGFTEPAGADGVYGTKDDDLVPPPGSPVVDAGDDDALGLEGVVVDVAGNARFVGPIDMGAHEAQ